eukprot:Pgem_evm1s14947
MIILILDVETGLNTDTISTSEHDVTTSKHNIEQDSEHNMKRYQKQKIILNNIS